jgi:hypothetical protein
MMNDDVIQMEMPWPIHHRKHLPMYKDISLLEFIELYDNGKTGRIRIPDHQRGDCWPQDRRKAWIEDIRTMSLAPGMFVCYQLGDDGTWWLNDGQQRLLATLHYYHNHEAYHDNIDTARERLRNCRQGLVVSNCETIEQAMIEFAKYQQITPMTRYESGAGSIKSDKMHKTIWERRIDQLNDIVWNAQARLTKRQNRDEATIAGRKRLHDNYRHHMALFLNYINEELKTYDVTTHAPYTPNEIIDGLYLEKKFINKLNAMGALEFDQVLKRFERFIDNTTSLLADAWKDCISSGDVRFDKQDNPIETLLVQMFRFALDIAIWAKVHNRKSKRLLAFYRDILSESKGKNNFLNARTNTTAISWREDSGAAKIREIAHHLESDFFDVDDPKRLVRNTSQIHKGNDLSHINDFSNNGEGDVIIEPTSINRSRGANPIEES